MDDLVTEPSTSLLAKLLPKWDTFVDELMYLPPTRENIVRPGLIGEEEELAIFDGYKWTRFTAENWCIPLCECFPRHTYTL